MIKKLSTLTSVFAIIALVTTATAPSVQAQQNNAKMNKKQRTYQITISNVSQSQPLAPGIYVVHDDKATLNFTGQLSPAEFEPLAEIGNPMAAAEFVRSLPGTMHIHVQNAPIMPGQTDTFEVMAVKGSLLSGLQMPAATNDGLALIDSVELSNKALTIDAKNYDNGTEENSALNSGFDGGQPDPARGAENIDNGAPTEPQALFGLHPQLKHTVLQAHIMPVKNKHAEKDCKLMARDQNNMAMTFANGDTVAVGTNIGLYLDANEMSSYQWYADYDQDGIEPQLQPGVNGHDWSYTTWAEGSFNFKAVVTYNDGSNSSCSFTVHSN